MLKNLKQTNDTQNFVLKPSILMKDGEFYKCFNPIQDGGGAKTLPTSFSPVTSTNVGTRPQNFLPFSLTLLTYWCKMPSLYLVPVPNY